MINLIKDNSLQNRSDFNLFVRECLYSYYGPQTVLKSPVNKNYKTTEEDKIIFDAEFQKYKQELELQYQSNGSSEEWNIFNENGDYIFPNVVRNEQFDQTFSERFIRIYVGLNLRYLTEFFREFDKLAGQQHLKYYYKLHQKQSTDKFVIYPRNEHIFQICDIISIIKKQKPYLFKDSIDKLLTTKIAPGIGLASDNPIKKGLTFSTSMRNLIHPYLKAFYDTLPAPKSRMAIFLYLKKYLIATYPECYNQNTDWKSLIPVESCDKVINALKNNQNWIRLPNIKQLIILWFPAKLCTTPNYKIDEFVKKFGDINYFKQWLDKNHAEKPSDKNLAFSQEQIELLEKIYTSHKPTSNAILEHK